MRRVPGKPLFIEIKNKNIEIWRFNSNKKFDIVVSWLETPWLKMPLLWRHNEHDSVSNHQPRGCLLNRLFRRRSKKSSKLRVTGHCVGNSPGPVNSPHKGPVTRKMFPFDDVIMPWRACDVTIWILQCKLTHMIYSIKLYRKEVYVTISYDKQSGLSRKVVALFLLQTLVAISYDYFNCMIQSKWNQIIHESTLIMII